MLTSSRDNWERLVAAVVKRQQIWELCHQQSRTPSICSTITSDDDDDLSEQFPSFSGSNFEPFSVPLSPLLPPTYPSISQVKASAVGKNASSRSITQMLFSALYGRRKSKDQHLDDIPEYTEGQLERFSLRQLQVATDTFSAKNLLGRGGSGKVYKGHLVNGTLVAVKRLNMVQTTGKEIQFHTEVQMFRVMAVHRNILRLRGFCTTTKERLLVYPYMAKGSVASCLRERPQNVPPLDWGTRKCIALGIARGLSFLHEHCDPKIIHRDVKAANIFLDEGYEAVVRDFSLAKLMDHNDTHETTAVRGTIGHIAPEYLSTGKMSEKTDVFAYGVTLLELITAQRAFDLARLANDEDVMLLDWVKGQLKEKKLETVVDPDLHSNYVYEEVEQLIQVALLCTQTSELGRPMMSEVVRLLEGDGLAEKWDEWQKVEMTQQEVELGVFGKLERFSLHQLRVATDMFSNKNLLERGRFGKVYKGQLIDGTLIAIKRLTEEWGPPGEFQFVVHVEMISKAVHHNLLSLRGFCMTPTEWFLVYPYMVNGNVASCLRARPPNIPPLDWWTRKRIALGCARGLSYLHDHCDPKIIHGDVKAANIFLDEDFEAIVGDIGLYKPKLMDHEVTDIGHLAPEYLCTGKMSEKTDVFAYGVTLLELLTGQRVFDLARLANTDDAMLLDWVKGLLKEKKLAMLVDPVLHSNYVEEEVEQLIEVALLCTQTSPLGRPKMSEVVRLFEGNGLAEKWDEWQKVEEVELASRPTFDLENGDSIENLEAVILSGPR